jgi:hypothetical protein
MSPSETWWCVEVESAADADKPVGCVRDWQAVLDRAAAVRRLGDTDVPGYTGLFRVRSQRDSDRFFLVSEGPEAEPGHSA